MTPLHTCGARFIFCSCHSNILSPLLLSSHVIKPNQTHQVCCRSQTCSSKIKVTFRHDIHLCQCSCGQEKKQWVWEYKKFFRSITPGSSLSRVYGFKAWHWIFLQCICLRQHRVWASPRRERWGVNRQSHRGLSESSLLTRCGWLSLKELFFER